MCICRMSERRQFSYRDKIHIAFKLIHVHGVCAPTLQCILWTEFPELKTWQSSSIPPILYRINKLIFRNPGPLWLGEIYQNSLFFKKESLKNREFPLWKSIFVSFHADFILIIDFYCPRTGSVQSRLKNSIFDPFLDTKSIKKRVNNLHQEQ